MKNITLLMFITLFGSDRMCHKLRVLGVGENFRAQLPKNCRSQFLQSNVGWN